MAETTDWMDGVTAEEIARQMAETAAKLQEAQPQMTLATLMKLLYGAIQGEKGRRIQL